MRLRGRCPISARTSSSCHLLVYLQHQGGSWCCPNPGACHAASSPGVIQCPMQTQALIPWLSRERAASSKAHLPSEAVSLPKYMRVPRSVGLNGSSELDAESCHPLLPLILCPEDILLPGTPLQQMEIRVPLISEFISLDFCTRQHQPTPTVCSYGLYYPRPQEGSASGTSQRWQEQPHRRLPGLAGSCSHQPGSVHVQFSLP